MWVRSLSRLLRWFPALLLLCAVSFLIMQALPGDPVLARLHASGMRSEGSETIYQSVTYRKMRQSQGLDLPTFYFTLKPQTAPDTLRLITHPQHRKVLRSLCIRFGKSDIVLNWYRSHLELQKELIKLGETEALSAARSVLDTENYREQKQIYEWIFSYYQSIPAIGAAMKRTVSAHVRIETQATPIASFIPDWTWHGSENQFHGWLVGSKKRSGVLKGNLGISLRDGQPVLDKVIPAFRTTFTLALLAIIIMYSISIPLGLQMARTKYQKRSKLWTRVLFGLYAIPSFWLAVLMLTFLCNPKYLNWFPAAYSLMNVTPEMSWFEQATQTAYHLVLPVFCWSLGGISFLSLQTYQKSKSLQLQPFITAARAKGVHDRALTFHHVGKNALVPTISLLGSIIPISLSGAIAIELIFSIPGMGQLIFDSFHIRDYPVVMAILMLIGLAAILGTALSDFMLYQLDPRLKSELQQ